MSCPEDARCLLYAEGELEGSELRELEAHLVGCLRCRELVVALRDEGRLLGEVLRGEAPRPAPEPVPVPERGVALGVPITIAAVSVALAAATALIEARLPGALDLIHPRRLRGAADMAFDLVFLLRENAPGLLELAFAVGVVASISALGSLAVSSLSRRVFGGSSALLALWLCVGDPAAALELNSDEELRIGAGERLEETLIATGERIDIDGVIDGDLIAAAERVTLRGEVTGSLYVFARDLEVSGKVGGSIHAATRATRIEGRVAGQIFVFAEEFHLAPEGSSGGDVSLGVEEAHVDGAVGRDLYVVGERAELRGSVGRDLQSHRLEELLLRDGSRVGRDVSVRMEAGRSADRSPGAQIGGELSVEELSSHREHYLAHYRSWRFYGVHLLWFGAALVFGLILYRLAPGVLGGSIVTSGDLFRTLAWGFAAMVVVPLAILATALTIVGIPVAVAALFLYLAALYTADLVVAAWLGRLIRRPSDDSNLAFARSFALGLLVLTLVALVPFIGPAVGFVGFLLGLGLLTLRAREAFFGATGSR